MRRRPLLYEVNACIFLKRMAEKYHRKLTLSSIPEVEWQLISRHGFDLLWLMGVWQRSNGSREQALHVPGLLRDYAQAIPDWTGADIAGSPYAIYNYNLEPALGRAGELQKLKSILNQHGFGLVLDFVPNHLAVDHPWTISHPEYFVQGKDSDVRDHPDWFFSTKPGIHLAHGRDPNFPPWGDTVQVNFFSEGLRQALINELLLVSKVCDGVRCDMAMLALNDVFEKVWGSLISGYRRPVTEFWTEAITQVKKLRPDFLFIAETYWGLEDKLLELGIDFTYDKTLYDRLRFSTPAEIRDYLSSDTSRLEHSAHFIENHDEPRAAVTFGRERSLAAAVITSTLPGLRFFHDGQLTGKQIRLPVQMIREPEEVTDSEIKQFYERLCHICNSAAFHQGEWELMETGPAWEGNQSYRNLLAWSWSYEQETKIVIVNYSADAAQCRLKVPPPPDVPWLKFTDELTGSIYIRDPLEVSSQGLYIALDPYHTHILDMSV
jgi:glycosidase